MKLNLMYTILLPECIPLSACDPKSESPELNSPPNKKSLP